MRFKNARRRWVGEDNPKPSLRGSVAGCRWAAGGGVGFCESVRPSIPQVPRDNEWRVSGYCGMGWFVLTWDPPVTPSLLDPLSPPIHPFLPPPWALYPSFVFDSVPSKYKTMHRQGVVSYLVEFQSPTVFDHDCNFNHGIIS